MSKVTLITTYLAELNKLAEAKQAKVKVPVKTETQNKEAAALSEEMKERLKGGALYGAGSAVSQAVQDYRKATKKRWWRGGKSKEKPIDSLKSLGKQVGGRILHSAMSKKTHDAAAKGYEDTGRLQSIRDGYRD